MREVAALGCQSDGAVRLLLDELGVLRGGEVPAVGDVGLKGVLEGHIGVVAVVDDEVDLLLPRLDVLLLLLEELGEVRVVARCTVLRDRGTRSDLAPAVHPDTGCRPCVVLDVDQGVLGLLEGRVPLFEQRLHTLRLGGGVRALLRGLAHERLGDLRVDTFPVRLVRLRLHPVQRLVGELLQPCRHLRPVVGRSLELPQRGLDDVVETRHARSPEPYFMYVDSAEIAARSPPILTLSFTCRALV